ncbi:unnamed protein product, partial [Porites lobata]
MFEKTQKSANPSILTADPVIQAKSKAENITSTQASGEPEATFELPDVLSDLKGGIFAKGLLQLLEEHRPTPNTTGGCYSSIQDFSLFGCGYMPFTVLQHLVEPFSNSNSGSGPFSSLLLSSHSSRVSGGKPTTLQLFESSASLETELLLSAEMTDTQGTCGSYDMTALPNLVSIPLIKPKQTAPDNLNYFSEKEGWELGYDD